MESLALCSSEVGLETVDEWYRRVVDYQRSIGQQPTTYAWQKWIAPRIGGLTWREVTPHRVEAIRDDLDRAVVSRQRGGRGLLGSTAYDIWFILVGAVRIARRSKRRDLRALDGVPSPCVDIEPPGDPNSRRNRRKTFVYPIEFDRLVQCVRVPRAWRELYAISGYTYLRPGELTSLRWADVNLEHRTLRISKAYDYSTHADKAPKTFAGFRDVPIAPTLLPMLQRMRSESASDGYVAPLLRQMHRVSVPVIFRRHLLIAGIDRPALHESTLLTIRANFRTWRDSGITWLAMSGLGIDKISRRAGHADLRATMRYVKLAEDLSAALGEPFGELPPELVDGKS